MFDAVFLMGPLYHLTDSESREKALKEAVRVLRRGGYLFCSFILTFGNVIYILRLCEKEEYLSNAEHLMVVSKKK